MALDPKTPGVYIQEVSIFPPSIVGVATAIPAFLGYTENAVADPTRISSMNDYESVFGGPQPYLRFDGDDGTAVANASTQYFLYYAMQMYFANGGGPCYVISVGTYSTSPLDTNFGTSWNTGALGLLALEDEPTLIVMPELRLLVEANAYGVYKAALEQCSRLQDRFVIIDVHGTIADFRTTIGNQYLKYGASYYPDLETTLSYPDAAVIFNASDTTASNLSGETLAAAVADANEDETTADQLIVVEKDVRDLVAEETITLPPSSAIAGIYATVDRTRGVWKAPANVSVNGVLKPSELITNDQQDDMNKPSNGKAVNAIRSFTGRGILVWGARTLAGNDNEWRYVPVRRLFIYVEESIKKATEFVVFEPNDGNTWLRVKTMIQNFLLNLWKDGALAGAVPDDAFFVKVGLGETMTSQDILEGKLIIEIGMAAVRPAEFIILKFSHKLQES